jgi:hypothetical protein
MSVVESVMAGLSDVARRGWYPRVFYLNDDDFRLMRIHMDERDGKWWFNGVEIRPAHAAPPIPDVVDHSGEWGQ